MVDLLGLAGMVNSMLLNLATNVRTDSKKKRVGGGEEGGFQPWSFMAMFLPLATASTTVDPGLLDFQKKSVAKKAEHER